MYDRMEEQKDEIAMQRHQRLVRLLMSSLMAARRLVTRR